MSSATSRDIYLSKSFQRAVRRCVRSPLHRFAAIVQPAFADLCEREIHQLGLTETIVSDAGVEFLAKMTGCYQANLWLRTATRVVMRFPEFRAGAIEQLYRRVVQIPWELWLRPEMTLQVDMFLSGSRIRDEKPTSDSITAAIRKRLKGKGLAVPVPFGESISNGEKSGPDEFRKQRIIVLVRRNRCVLSMDTSGPLLHRRGYRQQHSGAPMRETLAAAILLKAGWNGQQPLIDAMTGSGTIAIEAAMIARRMAPGINRSFLFQKWPCFLASTWAYLHRKARKQILPRSPVRIIALDKEQKAVMIAQGNAERIGVDQDIEWKAGDFFELRPDILNVAPGLVIVDPPYGKRLSGGGSSFYAQLGVHLRRHFRGWQAAVLATDRRLIARLGIPAARIWRVQHGGLAIHIALFHVG